MKETTKKEIKKLIKVNGITNPNDERIETCIADRFPSEYSSEQEYINFQQEIAEMVKAIPWVVIPYTVIDEKKEIINYQYAGHSFTMPLDCDGRISADDDAGISFEVKYILDIDEEKELLFIEK